MSTSANKGKPAKAIMKTARIKRAADSLLGASSALLLMLLFGCNLAPKYQRPPTPAAPAYKEAAPTVWKPAAPKDSAIRGNWWEMFGDSQLNSLEDQIDARNQSIALASADYAAARAIVKQTRAQYSPTVTTTPAITYSRLSASPFSQTAGGFTYTDYSFPLTASWEPDFWGRIRNSVRASTYAAQASAADLENVRLLAHASLAADYFQLRGIEQQKRILDGTVAAWQNYLDLTSGLYKSGLETDEALAAAESQLKAAQAQDTNLDIARAQYEHAIAVLVGASPSSFSIAAETGTAKVPDIPAGIPADLLERRPDIAAAERAVAQANAQIGVARAAYYPNITLSATGGLESLSFTDWFTWPSRFWSVGPAASETIFDAGARKATVQQAWALHDASVANYRQTVLTSFQQVEDNLVALRILAQNLEQQDAAVQSAKRFLNQATARNVAGLDPFLNVLTAQVNLLNYQQTYVNFQTQQMLASVQLIEGLGGGWNSSRMPTPAQITKASAKQNGNGPSTSGGNP